MQRQRGLTLLELLVVLAIIAISSAGVALAMRDNSQTQLEREAQRLIAKLEAPACNLVRRVYRLFGAPRRRVL